MGDAMVAWLTSSAAAERVAADDRVAPEDRAWVLDVAVRSAPRLAEAGDASDRADPGDTADPGRDTADDPDAAVTAAVELLDLKASFAPLRRAAAAWLVGPEGQRALDRLERTYPGIDPAVVLDGAERRVDTLMANRLRPFDGPFNAAAHGHSALRRSAYDDLRQRTTERRAWRGEQPSARPAGGRPTSISDPMGTHRRPGAHGADGDTAEWREGVPTEAFVDEGDAAAVADSGWRDGDLTEALIHQFAAEAVRGALAELQRKPLRSDGRDRRGREVGFALAWVAQAASWFGGLDGSHRQRTWAALRAVDEAWFFDPAATDVQNEQRRAQVTNGTFLGRVYERLYAGSEGASR